MSERCEDLPLSTKRKVVEVLLCAGPPPQPSCCDAAEDLGYGGRIGHLAVEMWGESFASFGGNYNEIAAEAAYRLIESSPTLRREWHGR